MTIEIVDTNPDNILDYGICGYKSLKHEGLRRKIDWLKKHRSEGIRIKTLYSDQDGTQGMIEYIPGEYNWRPVEAAGYMFIHCVFVGFKREYKGKGYGSLLLKECLNDAEKDDMHGVAVVASKDPFMAGEELFIKNGFAGVDTAPPGYTLLVKKFDRNAPTPRFKGDWNRKLSQYNKGLTIFQSDQCPYVAKCVPEISDVAENVYGIKPKIIDLKNCQEAQDSPCPFGIFGIIYNGKIIAEHVISSKRFSNIMSKELKG